ncbi:putative nucleotide-diphospho-sugar transferase [Salipiger bermudensis]|uniref:putative nucleotide-diphospho-sugar transferase n=1 Tax=Salipiger bermudensis TaxID=344736 RepID=UPI001CD53A1F|nr:putative nucleotide-diphospho-sugar transferase [Salipiger bermudensis]MCA0960847.1 glycosyltransferase family 77 protein [Salipiger bermudensis]
MERNRFEAQGFVVLICCDSNFFELAQVFERNLLNVQGSYPVIGDLGLTETQRAALQSELIDLRSDGSFREFSEAGYILTTHKPAAIREVIRRFGLPCLALDADMLLTARLQAGEYGGADIAVTPRMRRREKRFEDHRNGYLNAGFFYAAATPEADAFLVEWQRRCEAGDKSDQLILSEMTQDWKGDPLGACISRGGLSLVKLAPWIYNDTRHYRGKVVHFKALGRRGKNRLKWERIARRMQRAPRLYGALLALLRRFAQPFPR